MIHKIILKSLFKEIYYFYQGPTNKLSLQFNIIHTGRERTTVDFKDRNGLWTYFLKKDRVYMCLNVNYLLRDVFIVLE